MKEATIEASYQGKDRQDYENGDMIVRVRMMLDEYNTPDAFGYLFGFRGTPFKSGQFHPFVIAPDGRTDFGSSWENDETRFGKTNLLKIKIEVGEIFNLTEDGENMPYKIARILDH